MLAQEREISIEVQDVSFKLLEMHFMHLYRDIFIYQIDILFKKRDTFYCKEI